MTTAVDTAVTNYNVNSNYNTTATAATTKRAKKGAEDYKSKLQRIVQQTPEEILEYVLVGEDGPAHDRVITMEVRLNSNVLGKGTGHSKREAEQYAARMALEYFEDEVKA